MPNSSMKRTSGGSRWNDHDNRRSNTGMQNRQGPRGGGGRMISPWETGLAPGQLMNPMAGFQSQMSNQMMNNTMMDRSSYADSFTSPNKIRRLDMMGNYDDRQGGRGLLPAPIAPLMGAAPQGFGPSRSSNLQQRLGPWPSPKSEMSNRVGRNMPQRSNNNHDQRKIRRPARRFTPSRPSSRNKPNSNQKRSSPKRSGNEEQTTSQSAGESSSTKTDEKSASSKPKEERKAPVDDYPVEALYCHVCDLKPFTSRRGFIRHLEGISHTKMAETFHARNDTIKNLLLDSLKLAEMRRKDKTIRSLDKKPPAGRLVEQQLLRKYNESRECCSKVFKSHYDYYEHKLSLTHLRTCYERGTPEERPVDVLSNATVEIIDAFLEEAKTKSEDDPITFENVSPYDPTKAIGAHFIEKIPSYKCSICKESSILCVEEHCKSSQHFDHIIKHLNEVEAKRAQDERKEKENKTENDDASQNNEEPEAKDEDEEDHERLFKEYLQEDDDMIILDEDDREHNQAEEEEEEVAPSSVKVEPEETKNEPEIKKENVKEKEEPLEELAEVGNSVKTEEYDPEEPLLDTIVHSSEETAPPVEEVSTPRRSGRALRNRAV